jgi:hypothetical protein
MESGLACLAREALVEMETGTAGAGRSMSFLPDDSPWLPSLAFRVILRFLLNSCSPNKRSSSSSMLAPLSASRT